MWNTNYTTPVSSEVEIVKSPRKVKVPLRIRVKLTTITTVIPVGITLIVATVLFVGWRNIVNEYLLNLKYKKYKNYKIERVIEGDSIYGFFTYKIDTTINKRNNSVSYKMSFKDAFTVPVAYLINEGHTTTVDSVVHFYNELNTKVVHSDKISDIKMYTFEEVRNYIINTYKPVLLENTSFEVNILPPRRNQKVKKNSSKRVLSSRQFEREIDLQLQEKGLFDIAWFRKFDEDDKEHVTTFVRDVWYLMFTDALQYDIAPSVKTFKAGLESDWGRSTLATVNKALYGIKQGKTAYKNILVDEVSPAYFDRVEGYKSKYCSYSKGGWPASIRHHSEFITDPNWHYAVSGLDAEGYIRKLSKYASDKNYKAKLRAGIKEYHLTVMDEVFERYKNKVKFLEDGTVEVYGVRA